METPHRARLWFGAFRWLAGYDRIPGYRRLSWRERKCIDHAAVVMLLRTPSFWRAFFWVGVATVLMYVVSWTYDLVGAPRDLLRALPLIATFPTLAAARRKNIRWLLLNRDVDHGHTLQDA